MAVATEVAKEFLSRSFWWFGCRDELMNEHFIAIFVWYEMTTEKFTEGEGFVFGGDMEH